jgi:hypothetical protein
MSSKRAQHRRQQNVRGICFRSAQVPSRLVLLKFNMNLCLLSSRSSLRSAAVFQKIILLQIIPNGINAELPLE